ncbi:selenoprotein Pa [Xyrichtys novacula]|uniref:Selenoprotein Pa n=1 Tax=Xyrichtys novacula TaxID=13765 RepID=A0AAV1G4U5_XYRNO|nr:selenoprotein Pa [Xyrichtys novacula]
MRACLSLLFTLCLLHGGGAESDGGGRRCQLPPAWRIGELEPMKGAMGQASRLESLRLKLERQGLTGVRYIVVNDQGEQAQRLHPLLAQRLSENITLYKQDDQQPNVWQTLNGIKDDFLIYDRCGRLTHHISLPNSIIGEGHVESAIKDTYCKPLCGVCPYMSAEPPEECKEQPDVQPDNPPEGHDHNHGHGAHHQGHDQGHGHQGNHHGSHPGGSGHGRDHDHGQQHGDHGGFGHSGGQHHGDHGGFGHGNHDRHGDHRGHGGDNQHGQGHQRDVHGSHHNAHHDHHQGHQGQQRDTGVSLQQHQSDLEQLVLQMHQMQRDSQAAAVAP